MPTFDFQQLSLAIVIVTLSSSASGVLVPRQSGAPTCDYECKLYDDYGNEYVGKYYPPSVDYYGCTYYREVDGMGSSTNCIYSKEDGNFAAGLMYNAPEFKCPATMNQVCTPARRDTTGVYKAYLEKRERRAAKPAPSVLGYMATRASLLKRKSAGLENLD